MIELIPFAGDEAKNMEIVYSVAETRFGRFFIASTAKGICAIGSFTSHPEAENEIAALYPSANIQNLEAPFHLIAKEMIDTGKCASPLPLHVASTPFQHKVWSELLKIPVGTTISYGSLADRIGNRGGSRAVGSAVGANPVAILIPCHRVIRSDGTIGQYRWGSNLKSQLLDTEKNIPRADR